MTTETHLIEPHGGILKNLLLDQQQIAVYKEKCFNLPSWELSLRQICDVELLLTGGFSPLTGFMKAADYTSVLDKMRLADGCLWPIPVVLDVTDDFAKQLSCNDEITLRDHENVVIAIMSVEDIWLPDKKKEAEMVYGTTETSHPGVNYLLSKANNVYIGGKIFGFEAPAKHGFLDLRHTPSELRTVFRKLGWGNIVAFQTRNPMHRAHMEMTFEAAKNHDANLLIHPVVGMTSPGDIDRFTRVQCYKAIMKYYPKQSAMLSLLPIAMRMAGPREAVWHAIVRKNYGCNHFIVGRDHAGPGKDSQGNLFYDPYGAQNLLEKFQDELKIKMVAFKEQVYSFTQAKYISADKVSVDDKINSLSGTELRHRLNKGLEIPPWYSFPEVVNILRQSFPPKHKKGFTVFFTGLSGAGKSTLAKDLLNRLREIENRSITLLDGDVVRKFLSSELGFSKKHRELNISRIGFVAREITIHRGIAICAPIAPYQKTREEVRKMISDVGGFIEVYVSTPIEVCEQRDRKGLYQKARAGVIKNFTGITDPYEEPENSDLVINTQEISLEAATQKILLKLKSLGYLKKIHNGEGFLK